MNRRELIKILFFFVLGGGAGYILNKNIKREKRETEKVKILPSRCLSCGGCVVVCPKDAIHFPFPLPEIDVTKCIKCGNCEAVCPMKAIQIYPMT